MRTSFVTIPVALLMMSGLNGQLTAQAPVTAALIGPAVLDDWGNRFTTLGASVPRTPYGRKSVPPSHSWRCSMR
jgi:hypothetical protein